MTSAASAADGDRSSSENGGPPLLAAVVPLVPAWAVDKTFDYLVPTSLHPKVEIGTLVRVPFGGRKVRGVVVELRRAEPARDLEEIISLPLPAPIAPPPMPALFEWLAIRYGVPAGRAFEKAVPPRVRVRAVAPAPIPRVAGRSLLVGYEGAGRLLAAVSSGGSGVYSLRPLATHERGELIAELVSAVDPSGAALVLVPEVRYGSVVMDRLSEVHPEMVRLDSSVDDMERSVAWMRMAAGHGLAVGGRAAVFAPSPELRLIVVDEEHDGTYKEDRSPRYDARAVAIERARLQGAVCVLLSPTPLLASIHEPSRVTPPRAQLREARPVVELAGVPDEGGLSSELHARVRDALRAGGSVALLAPTRGYARSLWCSTCRRSVRCPRCEAGVIYEGRERRIRCPRCGWSAAAPDVCPACGSIELRFLGRGSERYAEQLGKAFPRVPLVHMDRARAEAARPGWEGRGIYLTTWFGTKPELRPPVSLVGVLDADVLIRKPDFKAAEQAHQALVEMSAWAGPASNGGRLVIQTNEPNHHAVQAVVRGDYDFFAERELEQRRELGYPPFKELVKISVAGDGADDLSGRIAAHLRELPVRVLGPIDARFPTGSRGAGGSGEPIAGRQLLVKCDSAQEVAARLRDILRDIPRSTRLRVDADPR